MRRLLLTAALLGLAACAPRAPDVDFDTLRGDMSEAQARALQPTLAWACHANTGNVERFGQRYCEAPVTTLGDLKATSVTYTFRDGVLIAAVVEYTPGAFKTLSAHLDAKFKRHEFGATGAMKPGRVAWDVKDGIVLSSATDLRNGNVFAMWFSIAEASNYEL